jgi:hypothetical protein
VNGPDGERFVWGSVYKTHSIGPYEIVEFIPTEAVKAAKKAGLEPHKCLRQFHPYVNAHDTSVVAPTLDGALCLAIAYRHNVVEAGRFMMKLVAPEAT